MKQSGANSEKRLLGLAPQSNSSHCLVLILDIQLGNYLFGTGDSYGLTAQYMPKTSCKSMFDTYQQHDYLLSPRTESGQLDFFEMLFSFLKSVQNLLVSSFLSTPTIGKLQGDMDGQIIFTANISFTALSTIACLAKGVLHSLNLMHGWLIVLILILGVLDFPRPVSFSAKRSTK